MLETFVALVHKAAKKSAPYGVIFPDFPGCVAAGETIDEALKHARESILFHMEGMLDAGETIPKPSSLEKILANPEYKQAIACLMHIIPPTGQLKRVNITMDVGLLLEIDSAAHALGKNRSEFLAASARQMLL